MEGEEEKGEEKEGTRVQGHRRPTTTDDVDPPRHSVAEARLLTCFPLEGPKLVYHLPASSEPFRPFDR